MLYQGQNMVILVLQVFLGKTDRGANSHSERNREICVCSLLTMFSENGATQRSKHQQQKYLIIKIPFYVVEVKLVVNIILLIHYIYCVCLSHGCLGVCVKIRGQLAGRMDLSLRHIDSGIKLSFGGLVGGPFPTEQAHRPALGAG